MLDSNNEGAQERMLIHKMILTDENMHPVAVQIPYKEWLEIELLMSKMQIKKSRIAHLSGTIKLTEDPLQYQRNIRDEWQ
jgi:hypothetical protein